MARLKQRRIPEQVAERAAFLAALHPIWSGSRVFQEVERDFPKEDFSERTIRDIVIEARQRESADAAEPWTLREGDAESSPVLLSVLAALTRESGGGRRHLTRQEASWIQAVHAAATDLSPWQLFLFARLYMERTADEKPTDDLDALLAFGFWRGEEQTAAYNEAIKEGWVRQLHPFAVWSLFPDRQITFELLQKEESK